MRIYRELLDKVKKQFDVSKPVGLILSGIVGCGKTTLVEMLFSELQKSYELFIYSGDDVRFRHAVAEDTKYILNDVKSKTKKKALVFVDEIQKSEEAFDAIKVAFDSGLISFIVSGSNPAYLNTIAKKRLQRRADLNLVLPISLRELSIDKGFVGKDVHFENILWKTDNIDSLQLPKCEIPPDFYNTIQEYFIYGGLPLVLTSEGQEKKLREIKLTVERGFDLMSKDNNSIAETIRIELADLHSQEFAYKNILNKTRLRRRDTINVVIDELINHGYLYKKSPILFYAGKSSYLSTFSYTDPGIVSYLTGDYSVTGEKFGFRVEGYIHARLSYIIYNSVFKSQLYYYKPHALDSNKNIRYQPGEIDFIFSFNKKIIPIEVKATLKRQNINTTLLLEVIDQKKSPFGVILYGGEPYIDYALKILYWPYWLV